MSRSFPDSCRLNGPAGRDRLSLGARRRNRLLHKLSSTGRSPLSGGRDDAVGLTAGLANDLLSVTMSRGDDLSALGRLAVQQHQYRSGLRLQLSAPVRRHSRATRTRSAGRAEPAQEIPYLRHLRSLPLGNHVARIGVGPCSHQRWSIGWQPSARAEGPSCACRQFRLTCVHLYRGHSALYAAAQAFRLIRLARSDFPNVPGWLPDSP